ncbi:MAG: dehydrogenase, partial [Acidobacteria bacterium]
MKMRFLDSRADRFWLVLAAVLFAPACTRPKPSASLDPAEFIATARIAPDCKLELAAREPNVVDPVALAFDADGRMFVVEMRDYPTGMDGKGSPGGRVKLLEDADGDGYFEKATVFADGLQYPTSVLPWRGGILVTSPPDILF